MRKRLLLAAAIGALAAAGPTATATAGERVAVLIVDDGDEAIGEYLTEVAIARLAEAGDRELVGTREILERMPRTMTGQELGACLLQPACLAEIGAIAFARRAIVGAVHRHGATCSVSLRFIDLRTGAAAVQMSRESPADIEHVIAAIQELTGDIEKPGRQAPTPAPAPTSVPGVVLPAAAAASAGPTAELREPRSHLRDVAYVSGGLAIVAFSAAAVSGNLAAGSPTGATRAEAYADLQRRKDYATATSALLIGGAALLALAVVTFVW